MTLDARSLGTQRPRQQSHHHAGASPSTSSAGDLQLAAGEPVVIDCDRCSVRGTSCGDCMVTVLLGGPPFGVALDADERRAIDVLSDAGLIPPLRMVEAGLVDDGPDR